MAAKGVSIPSDPAPEQASPLRRATAVGALLAAAALVPTYFSSALPPWAQAALGAAQLALAGLFVLERALAWTAAKRRLLFLQDHWPDLAMVTLAAAAIVAGRAAGGTFLPAVGLYGLFSRLWGCMSGRFRRPAMSVLLALTGLAAVATLVLEYGFREPLPVGQGALHLAQTVVVALFILDRIVRLEHAPNRRAYLRENRLDFLLLLALAAGFLVARQRHGAVFSAGAVYVMLTQGFILVSLVLRAVSVNLDLAGSGLPPSLLLVVSFAAMCLVGSGLLSLPAATPEGEGIWYVDALFTATSATCVTGLVVRDTGRDFTVFGQAVILALIQLGGLGIMLFGTILAVLVGRGLSVRSSDALGQIIGTEGAGRLVRVAKFVIAMTLGFEAVGAVLLYPMFAAPRGGYVPTPSQAAWESVFHSVSAFCNAGFALFGRNMMQGVEQGWAEPLRQRWQVLGVIAPLIVLGGLGFPVLEDCWRFAVTAGRRFLRRLRVGPKRPLGVPRPRLSLHSKVVLATSAALIVLGAAGLVLLGPRRAAAPRGIGRAPVSRDVALREDPARWRSLPPAEQWRDAIFQSVSARTAGFNTIDMDADLTDAGRLLLCALMVVGGSPASTAGGMKTATFALLVLAAWSVIKRRDHVEAFRRTIAADLLRRAVTVGVLYLALLATVVLLLCVTMPGWDFMRLLFEACSACGTVGLSTGVTPSLSFPARGVIIFAMFAGRVGPLTLLLAATGRLRRTSYAYPSADLLIG